MFNDLRREVIAGFVDIGGTADNQLFELSFYNFAFASII
jgi:hypothetical protein